MNIKTLKLFQSVKVGTKELNFVTNSNYSIELINNLIKITDLSTKESSYTSLYNSPWFTLVEEVPKEDTKAESFSIPTKKPRPPFQPKDKK